jgi:hypothetical protein
VNAAWPDVGYGSENQTHKVWDLPSRNSQASYPDQRNTLLLSCTYQSFLYQTIAIMGDHDYPATCLSSFEHGNDVRDVVLHYFGCLREAEREVYFKQLPHHKQDRITKERNRILEQRALFEVNDRTKDLLRKFRKSLSQLPFVRGRTGDTRHSGDDLVKLCKENAWGMSAYVISFRNSERYTDPNCSDHFPKQKLDVKDLLYNKDEKTNPLMRPCEKDEIRYFHLPGNNMEWIEYD